MSILSLHHITIVCQSAQRTADFYTRVLGLRLVKRTVNFDAPTTYHLYFGNERAEPASLVTFFEWPNASRGAPGIGARITSRFTSWTTTTFFAGNGVWSISESP
jgi:glyoxalase family protein